MAFFVLLLAATNFAELIDPALWRRFDLVLNFEKPNSESIKGGIKRFMAPTMSLLLPA